MKEFVDKLISRLEELKKLETDREDNCDENGYWNDCEDAFEDGESSGRFQAVVKILKIVNQFAEEYKTECDIRLDDGWIPCSERLPNSGTHKDVWITLEDVEDAYKAKWYLNHFEWENGIVIKGSILAWMPYNVPAPYQPKGKL